MPNRTHTDSTTVEYHEDGSWTETSTITHIPATTGQKAAAFAGLGVMCVAPFVPLLTVVALEKWEARKERKRKAALKSVD